MSSLGVMEIFYGLPWSEQDRNSYASFMREFGFGFYLYGPKADDCLRKNWRRPLSQEELKKYTSMRKNFVSHDIQFGIILSPHGLESGLNQTDRHLLQEKVKALNDVGLHFFGLFFDDMKSSPELASIQLEIARLVEANTTAKVIFCPSFYCNDPLLDMLFGERPKDYLAFLGKELSSKVEILWTGEQIISPEITSEQLGDVESLLKRKPFICDNFFADDGPLNCQFLRLLPLGGRKKDVFGHASHWAFNPMNQAHLSKLVLMAVSKYLRLNQEPEAAFESTIGKAFDPKIADVVRSNSARFLQDGLESISEGERAKLRQLLTLSKDPYARELIQWLDGHYAIDFLAMIEQSCYVG